MTNKLKNRKTIKPVDESIFSKKNIIYLSIILFISFIAFSPILNNEFVKWDDDWYVQENPQMNDFSFSTITNIFSNYYKGQYSPVSTVLVAIQYNLGSKLPILLHLGSILFHLLNIYLVFYLAQLLFRKKNISLITAILFGITGMQVESVAWISAQKVLIFSTFYLLSIVSYLKFLDGKKTKQYWWSVLLFVFAVLSKEQALTLSISLFAFDYLKGRKLLSKEVLIEKIPFILISVFIGLVTIYSSRTGEFFTDENKNQLIHQIVYSSYAITKYIIYLILPFKLSAFHPYPNNEAREFAPYLLVYLLTSILLIFTFIKNIKRNKIIVFAIAFFIINLSLVLQLMPLRDFIIADRYIYIPSLGLFLLVAFYINKLLEKKKFNNLVYSVLAIYIVSLFAITYSHSNTWQNSISLFTDVVNKYPESSIGWNNKGLAMHNAGEYNKAIHDYKKAIEYNPTSVFSYNNLGITYSDIGNHDAAIKVYNAAIKMRADFSQAYFNRADTYSKKGEFSKSIDDYTKYISLNSTNPQAYISRGIMIAKNGDFQGALPDLNKAISLNKNNSEAYLNRGVIYLNLQNYKEAIDDFNMTLKFRPNFDYALFNRGIAKVSNNDKNGGCNDLQKAYKLGFKQAGNAIQQFCN